MGEISEKFNTAFRDNPVVGVPASGPHEPIKREIRAIALPIEANIAAAALSGTDLTAAMTLVAPLLSSAQSAQAAAEQARNSLDQAIVAIPATVAAQLDQAVDDATTEANASRDAATTAASAAQVFVGGKLYDTSALGLAGTTSGQFFAVPSTPRRTTVDVYKNQSGSAVKQVTYGSKLVSADEFTTPSDASTYAQSVDADVFLPAADFTGNLPATSDAVFEGDGRLFNSAGVQTSTYAEPRSRFVIGEEYLWAFHYYVAQTALGSKYKVVFSGDSTTYGAFIGISGGVLPDKYRLAALNDAQMARYGIQGPVSINSGVSGMRTSQWVEAGGRLDLDIAAYPDMALYVIRLGINDGSAGAGGIAAFRTAIRAGLARLRAFKTVQGLSIVLMTPNTTSETGTRDEAWMEQVARVLKKAARDYQCCFIDTYALWRDGRNGAVDAWLDHGGAGGSGIHPDGIFNLWIMNLFGRVVYGPLAGSDASTNKFINANGTANRTIEMTTPPSAFPFGLSVYRTGSGNTYPISGTVVTLRSADGITKQENIGFANEFDRRTYTRYAADGGWSDWRGLDYEVPLSSGWTVFNTGTPKLAVSKSIDGTVLLHGHVKNSAAVAGSQIAVIPVGFRSLVEKYIPPINTSTGATGLIIMSSNGALTWYGGTNTDVVIDYSFKAFN